jgi:hypothetical protein
MTDRRGFMTGLAALAAAGCARKEDEPVPPGEWIGPDPARGHVLREGTLKPADGPVVKTGVLIAGSGIGGLSAAWWLDRAGEGDYLVAELQDEAGGNSRGGHNAVSGFPLGAHYLPLPTRESHTLRRLLADLGALQGDPDATAPEYDERLLCAAPQERLFIYGHWQDGLVPESGIPASERDQIRRFFARVAQLRAPRTSGKPFALPMSRSSQDADLLALDRTNFRDWLLREGFTSPALHWYADYACRDDYGTPAARTSAWAGLHYFGCRDGEASGVSRELVLTTPEGNGWIAHGLAQRVGERLRCNTLVSRATPTREGWSVDLRRQDGSSYRVECRTLIWAAPLFVAARVIEGLPDAARQHAATIEYAPWLLAQLTLDRMPQDAGGAELSWDNVFYGSGSLGYVVATHQRFSQRPAPSVWTWYHALSAGEVRAERTRLLMSPREYWAQLALKDMARAHPDIAAQVSRVDCVRHGHAMARPLPGFLSAPGRDWFAAGRPDLQFAHADVSGFSLCEEAHARGVAAAERALATLHGRSPDPAVT